MCIRDRLNTALESLLGKKDTDAVSALGKITESKLTPEQSCLLYTSDAADERSSVDLGGRRIIKKKKNRKSSGYSELPVAA